MHLQVKLTAIFFLVLLMACNPSRRYFNKRIGFGHEKTEKPIAEKKITDTVAKQKPAPPLTVDKPTESKANLPGKDTSKFTQPGKSNGIKPDSLKVLPVTDEELFNFKAARKNHKHRNAGSGVLAGLFLLLFVFFSVVIFLAGLFIYRTSWSTGLQNLVFLGIILTGTVVCKWLMKQWNKAAYGE